MCTTSRLIDWVSVTLTNYTDMNDVLALFPVEFTGCERGLHGYRGQLMAEGGAIRILYDGGPKMGIHVQVSGQGCRLWEQEEPGIPWQDRFERLEALGASYSRLDYAFDSFDPTHGVDRVRGHLAAGSITSRWSRSPVRDMRSVTIGGESRGDTVYFGSDKSEARLRIYDKRAEVNSLELAHAGNPEAWTRYEFQFRNERANQIANLLRQGLEDAAAGVCRSYIEFRDYRLESNLSMAPVAAWWDEVISASKLVLTLFKRVAADVQRTDAWLRRQVCTAMAVMVGRAGGDVFGALIGYVEEGRQRLRDRHYQMIGSPIGAFG